MKKKMIIGYTTGVYDLFHVGHLNLLINAKSMCDKLIVGVTIDELVSYKNKSAVIPYEERIKIIQNLKCVDLAIPQKDMDKFSACKKLKVDYLFVGDDWYSTEKWEDYENELSKIGTEVIYFPYTTHISSTKLRLFLWVILSRISFLLLIISISPSSYFINTGIFVILNVLISSFV